MTLTDIDKMLDVKLRQRTSTTQETLNTTQKAITQTLQSMSNLLTNARNTDELDSEEVLSVFQALEKEIETLHALNATNGTQPTENIMAFLLTNITDALNYIVRGLELPTPPTRQIIDYANSVKKDLTKDMVAYLKKINTPPPVTPPSVTPPSEKPKNPILQQYIEETTKAITLLKQETAETIIMLPRQTIKQIQDSITTITKLITLPKVIIDAYQKGIDEQTRRREFKKASETRCNDYYTQNPQKEIELGRADLNQQIPLFPCDLEATLLYEGREKTKEILCSLLSESSPLIQTFIFAHFYDNRTKTLPTTIDEVITCLHRYVANSEYLDTTLAYDKDFETYLNATPTPPPVTTASVTTAPVTPASGKLTFCKMKLGMYVYTDENNMTVTSPTKLH